MNISQLKIAQRLGLGFGSVMVLLVALTGVALDSLNGAKADMAAAVTLERRAAMTDEWVASTRLNINRVMALAKSGNLPAVEAYFKPQIAETTERINGLQKALEAEIESERGKALLKDIGERRKEYIAARKAYFEALKAEAPPAPAANPAPGAPAPVANTSSGAQADEMLQASLLPAAERYIGAMVGLQKFEHEQVDQAVKDASLVTDREALILLGLAAAALLLGVVVAWRITRSVTAPLHEAVNIARTVAAGDLSLSVQTQRRDELGDLLKALGEMKEALVKTVSQVRSASDSIGVASSEIASGNQDLSSRTEQAASSLEQTAASMEELTATVRQSADAARQANQLAASASEIAVRGGQVVGQVVTTMEEINHSSKKINDIIGVIDGIAFQTNILALNAAVEAARAGEQGRGFAVVAAEVRNLAQRSAEAAKEIKGLIGASVEKVDAGTRLVADAGQTMSEIVGSVQRVSDIIGEITAASGEQSDGIGQVNVAVTQLDQMTQQNAALVEESAAAAESLKEQASRLAQVVQIFRIDGATPLHKPAPSPRTGPALMPSASPAPVTAVRAGAKPAPVPARAAAAPMAKPLASPAPASAKPLVAAGAEGDWESF